MPQQIDNALSDTLASTLRYLRQSRYPDSASAIADLSDYLYRSWYIRQAKKNPESHPPFTNLTQTFRSAHHGSYRWQRGWRVSRVSSRGRVKATRADRERELAPGDYIAIQGAGLLPKPGAEIEVVTRLDSTRAQHGFWISYSSAWETSRGTIVRLYWNLDPEGAITLVEQVSTEIDDQIPFSLKLPLEKVGYERADTAVLYFPRDRFTLLMPRLKRIHRALQARLYDETPRLTRQLAPGLGLAEDPPEEHESFGMNRCRLVAEALSNSLERQTTGPAQLLHEVSEHFIAAGIDPRKPYLNPGSQHDYSW